MKRNKNEDEDPAVLLSVPARNPGENFGGHGLPLAFSATAKLLSVETTLPFQPVNSAWVVYVPQRFGIVSAARPPPKNSTWSLSNGS